MSFMTILECRFILLISDIPGDAVAVDLAHTGDRNEGFIVDTQYSPLDSVQVPVAGDTVYDILVFMHVSTLCEREGKGNMIAAAYVFQYVDVSGGLMLLLQSFRII